MAKRKPSNNPFVPLNKRSKKAQKEYYQTLRGSWNGVKPITRTIPNKKKNRKEKDDYEW